MPFENGTFAFTAFRYEGSLPDNSGILLLLNKYAAQKLDTLGEDPQYGWIGHTHVLDTELTDANVFMGRYIFAGLRMAVRKIPSALLRGECRMVELNYMRQNNFERVSQKKRREIRDEVIRRRLPSMPPTLSSFEFVIDREHNRVYFGSAAGRAQQLFVQYFEKTFDIKLELINIPEMLLRLMHKQPTDLPPLVLESGMEEHDFPGRDFMTWLWYFSESEEGAAFCVDSGAPLQLGFDGPLSLTAAYESEGAVDLSLRKGLPTRSLEVKAALQVGKKLRKAKLMLTKDEPWIFIFDGDKYAFSGVILPEGEKMDEQSRFDERMDRLYMLMVLLEHYFTAYAKTMFDDKSRKELAVKMNQWIEARAGF